ncbi:hypothetical protein NG791_01545 [Laspinema sp. D1]|uniref:hypothetical protein n=1 Tax=Laspinema palackyanum TaxID=3231601 RepID=UPI0034778EEA|nr:hypothetical protein [Laspinema sp. D2b]
MKYTLNFALELKKDGEYIIYPDKWAGQPIPISNSEIIAILENFIKPSFPIAGIIEKPESPKIQSADAISDEKVQGEVQTVNENLSPQSPLKGLSGQAYYFQIKDLDDQKIQKITIDLSKYLKNCASKINSKNFFLDETTDLILGIKEVLEIRTYLAFFAKKPPNEICKNGYFFIMQI